MTTLAIQDIDAALVVSAPAPTTLVAALDPPLVLTVAPVGATLAVAVAQAGVATAPAAQGPMGPPGKDGAPGTAGDYGFVRYDEAASAPIVLAEGVPSPFRFLQPVTVGNSLRAPFDTLTALDPDGMTLRARKSGDSYLVRVRLSVVATRAGGTFRLDLFVTGNTTSLTGANSMKLAALTAPAGASMRIDELFQVFPGPGFAANGALFQMTSTVPATVTPESLFVTPLVAAS